MSAPPYTTEDVPEPPQHLRGVLDSIARHRLRPAEVQPAEVGEGSPDPAVFVEDQVQPPADDAEPNWSAFDGYSAPHYTQIPDQLFDQHMAFLTLGELRVLLYVMRRTLGFKRDGAAISLNEMVAGRRGRGGQLLDHGVGLRRRGVAAALASLEAKRLIVRERQQSTERGNEPTLYRLRLRP